MLSCAVEESQDMVKSREEGVAGEEEDGEKEDVEEDVRENEEEGQRNISNIAVIHCGRNLFYTQRVAWVTSMPCEYICCELYPFLISPVCLQANAVSLGPVEREEARTTTKATKGT